MADSKRLAVAKAITALLETEVAVANGYQHDLAGKVHRGRLTWSIREALPRVALVETLNPDREPIRAGWQPTQKDSLILLVQGHAEDDPEHPTDPAHLLMADVKRALARIMLTTSPYFRLGGLIADFNMEPGIVRPPDELSSVAYFYLRVRLEIVEYLADPYRLN